MAQTSMRKRGVRIGKKRNIARNVKREGLALPTKLKKGQYVKTLERPRGKRKTIFHVTHIRKSCIHREKVKENAEQDGKCKGEGESRSRREIRRAAQHEEKGVGTKTPQKRMSGRRKVKRML